MGVVDKRVSDLLSKDEIRDQIANYSRALDRIDYELGRSVFHPEATLDYGADVFRGSATQFIDWCLNLHKSLVSHSHQMSTISIWIDDENSARSETYGSVVVRRQEGDSGQMIDRHSLGRYIDKWEKRGETWRIINRRWVRDLDRIFDAVPGGEVTGARDRTDPSYFLD